MLLARKKREEHCDELVAVEPRMSAKSMVISTSAPPWCSDMNEKHDPHQFGFLSDAFLPMRRMSGAPAPANGAAQSRHRGSCGMSLKTRRPARSFECPRVRKSRQKSSFSVTGGFSVTEPSSVMDDAVDSLAQLIVAHQPCQAVVAALE